jgi:hypothetical protein
MALIAARTDFDLCTVTVAVAVYSGWLDTAHAVPTREDAAEILRAHGYRTGTDLNGEPWLVAPTVARVDTAPFPASLTQIAL